jgi:hypothetical protein
VLGREPPLAEWFSNLDASVGHSPGLFAGEPESDLAALIADPHARGIRIIVLEGADVNWPGLDLPPVANRSRSAQVDEALDSQASLAPPQPSFLLHDGPVRPGQSVTFPEGDVTDLGSIASGAEVIAGGSSRSMGPCAAEPSPDRPGIHVPASFARASKSNSWGSMAYAGRPMMWHRSRAGEPSRLGSIATKSS